MYRILCCLCLLVVQALPLAAANDVKTVQGLVGRLLPDYAKYFEFRQSKAGKDVFAIYSRRGKVVIEGNNANSMAVGLNYSPVKQIIIKGEYSNRFLSHGYNNEPSVSLGITYAGWFLK